LKKGLRFILGLALVAGILFGGASQSTNQQADPGGGGTGGGKLEPTTFGG
jgi:hypothetical protein